MHKLPNLILPAMVTLALAGPVIAQSSTTSSEGVGAVPEASTTIPESVEVVADVLTGQKEGQTMASKLIGLPLVNNEGKELGEVSDLIIDEKQQIVGATLSVGGFLGLGSGSIGVPWDSLRIDYRDGVAVAVTGMSEEQLADAPEFKTLAEIQAEKAALERAAQQQREMELQRQQMQPEQTEGQQQPSSQ